LTRATTEPRDTFGLTESEWNAAFEARGFGRSSTAQAAIASFTEALKSVPARDLKTGRDALVDEGWKLLRALGVKTS
jgi:hypothetical protein